MREAGIDLVPARVRPDASVVRTEAGHFLQEEVPEPLADAVIDVAGRARW